MTVAPNLSRFVRNIETSDTMTIIGVTQLRVLHMSRTDGAVVPTFIEDRVKGLIRGPPLEAGVFATRQLMRNHSVGKFRQ
jgi:hypothetical protein